MLGFGTITTCPTCPTSPPCTPQALDPKNLGLQQCQPVPSVSLKRRRVLPLGFSGSIPWKQHARMHRGQHRAKHAPALLMEPPSDTTVLGSDAQAFSSVEAA